MRVLIIGGTGLISLGIVKHLLERKAEVAMFNRGKASNPFSSSIKQFSGDRNQFDSFQNLFEKEHFDVVIDMICMKPEHAESDVKIFGGKCEQFIFCSTVCTYGVKSPPHVLIDETFPQEPTTDYGRSKVRCEQIFLKAHAEKKFKTTIVRPSHTYGPGKHFLGGLDAVSVTWDRVDRDMPIICSGDGTTLWQSTHRDDCGKLFAYAAGNAKCYGQGYNATIDRVFTWRDYYREAAATLGKKANLLFLPASWICDQNAERFLFLRNIGQFHGAYSSEKAKRDVPEFRCEIPFSKGAAEALSVFKQQGWPKAESDPLYQEMVNKALAFGIKPVEA
jgi:nucleoside-diphosphate-sugar epimerase